MPELARITVATLFNSLWEAALLALAVWLVLRLLPNLNATTRYAAWCIALIASVLLPLASALPQVTSVQTGVSRPVGRVITPVTKTAHAITQKAPAPVQSHRSQAAPTKPETAAAPFRLPERLRFSLPSAIALAIFAAWCLASLLLLVRLAVNLWRLETLKRDALPLQVDYRERLSRWTNADKGGREVRLCTSGGIDVPVAVGLFDSMILIPQHLLDTLTPEDMEQIMLHELGHLRRADDWTNGVQRVVQSLFFFNPAVLFIAQQLDLEREVACDDWVLNETKNVRPYATCLTKMAEVTAWPHRALAAPGVFVTRRGLSLRVERLLRAGRDIRTSLSLGAAGTVVTALIVMFFVLQTVAPSYAFTQEVPAPPAIAQAFKAKVALAATPKPPPKPAAKPATPKTIEREKIIYVDRSPAPRETTLIIPGHHVHMPARTIHIPAINIDIKEQRIHMPAPDVRVHMHAYNLHAYNMHAFPPVLPPDFAKNLTEKIKVSMRDAGMIGDFSGQNLTGRIYRMQRLMGGDFSHATLDNADFSGARISGMDFSHASLRGANFTNAHLEGCDFAHADLTGARFDGVAVTGCDFSSTALSASQTAAIVRGCKSGCEFTHADLRGADLRGIHVSGLDLSEADLRGADLSNATFSGVDFSGARMDGARLNGATFVNCSFDGVDKSRVDFGKARQIINGNGDPG